MTPEAYQTPHDIAVRGFRTLVENLGVGGALRFIQQYERGEGDYTAERKRLLRPFTLESMRNRRTKQFADRLVTTPRKSRVA